MLELALPPILSQNFVSLETKLQESLGNIRELSEEFKSLLLEKENYKTELNNQKEKCSSIKCSGAEAVKKILNEKNAIIELVGSSLTSFNETKNIKIITHIFKILCGESSAKFEELNQKSKQLIDKCSLTIKTEENIDISMTENCDNDQSMFEIEGTPTGRTSPIIQSKRSGLNKDGREKKKYSNNWPSPEPKAMVLSPTPRKKTSGRLTGRMKQQRLHLTRDKPKAVVDLTSSPIESLMNDASCSMANIKKEFIDNDETILPSPTSEVTPLILRIKFTSKDSPKKVSLSTIKKEKDAQSNIENTSIDDTKLDASINILKQLPKKSPPTPKKLPLQHKTSLQDENRTYCDIDSSESVLKNGKIEKRSIDYDEIVSSPEKRPLEENINTTNIEANESISLLQRDTKLKPSSGKILNKDTSPEKKCVDLIKMEPDSSSHVLQQDTKQKNEVTVNNNIKRVPPEPVEAIFKEPTVRKKAEKRALPGWSCDECEQFYDELYKDDPEMIAKKMEECSKHRGKRNPVPIKPPSNFWNPRWDDPPDDTEEFNRRNNAV